MSIVGYNGSMKVGVDVGALAGVANSGPSGVYRVTQEFLRTLEKYPTNYDFVTYRPEYFSPGWNYLELPLRLLKDRVEAYIGLSQALPKFYTGKKVLLVYDLGFEHYPKLYENPARLKRISQESVSRADAIVTMSLNTKEDLIRLYNCDSKKISVTYGGVSPSFIPRNEEDIREVRKRYNLQGDFFIFVGQNRQVKNIQFLIKVFEEVKKVQKDIFLVIVGRGYQIINSDAVRVLGRVPDRELSALYSEARSFVTASLYEGFGLPIVEAMACKCAVIASKVGALPDVVDDAGFLLQQNSQAKYTEAILLLAQDRQVRLDLANKGLERSKKFSWNRFTKDVVGQI